MVYRKLFAQKKDQGVQKKLYMDNLEAETIKIFSKLASKRSKTLLLTKKYCNLF